MALADLNPRDYARLFTSFKTAREQDAKIIPPLNELVPAIRKAIEDEGDVLNNLAVVFGEPIRRGFDLVRSTVSDKYGSEYATEVWERFLKKAT